MRYRIVIDDKIPFIQGVLEEYAHVVYLPGSDITPADVRFCDILIVRTRTLCNRDLLEGSSVKLILSATIGTDHIDTNYCQGAGIFWKNAPGCNSGSVMQYVASALLHWAEHHRVDLSTRVLGIIGVGNVGRKVAHLAGILGMRVLLNDPPRVRREGERIFCSLQQVLQEADILSFHVPLTREGSDATFHLADAQFFSKVNSGALVINTSRGEVIDSLALKQFLDGNDRNQAILDVWENEPDIDLELLSRSALATPHIAGYSSDGKANATRMVVKEAGLYMGLNLEDWIPVLPVPITHQLICNTGNKTFQQVVCELVLKCYPISEDDALLRRAPSDFERIRGSYRVRREFLAYTVQLKNACQEDVVKLEQLGFQVEAGG